MKISIIIFFAASVFYSCSENSPQQPVNGNSADFTQIDFDPVLSSNKDTIVYVNSNVQFEFTGL